MNLVYALAVGTEKAEIKSNVNQIVTDYFMPPRSQYINWVKANKAESPLLGPQKIVFLHPLTPTMDIPISIL